MKKTALRIISVIAALAAVFAFASCGAKNTDKEQDTSDNGSGSNTGSHSESHYNFLVLGHDRAANLTDVIMLISYNTDGGELTIMQIPRDTFIDYGGNNYKINSVYSHMYNAAKESGKKNVETVAARDFASILEKSLCVKIHYATVMDLDGFEEIVDAVGGVDMYVPYDMYYQDIEQGLYINLKEGQQKLDGSKAEQFVRFRSGYAMADIARGDAQKLFMTAFIESVKNNISVSTLSSLASSVLQYVDTELSAEDIVYFGKSALNISLDKVTMLTMPGRAVTGSPYYVMNRAAVLEIIGKYYNIYDFEITDSIFDKEEIYCNTTSSDLENAYREPKENANESTHTGSDISENSIDIKLK